ncbi:ssDNA-binding transcriptional regulator [Cavenderia fasciculata]|uniref:SsDNA-binding transcriptional regulator n=1 Tax=Cavenderia fasciculata TaxID=261658 RepID=F4PU30_CACFS|nr:ssDNA-binding transcriptional regulator [Cavenderia fasciculata]EGG20956.1 ssDNA-binding transcriptional regulator [Cavenderia fasciculata]|eukprot:XP_004358806.1 ssDNA-binding transcriptional regulator [Cavenderia fasciculata]
MARTKQHARKGGDGVKKTPFKKYKGGAAAPQEGPSFQDNADKFMISKLKVASRSVFGGVNRVDLRTVYENKEGAIAPTQKGISFSLEEWNLVKQNIALIDSWFAMPTGASTISTTAAPTGTSTTSTTTTPKAKKETPKKSSKDEDDEMSDDSDDSEDDDESDDE